MGERDEAKSKESSDSSDDVVLEMGPDSHETEVTENNADVSADGDPSDSESKSTEEMPNTLSKPSVEDCDASKEHTKDNGKEDSAVATA